MKLYSFQNLVLQIETCFTPKLHIPQTRKFHFLRKSDSKDTIFFFICEQNQIHSTHLPILSSHVRTCSFLAVANRQSYSRMTRL